MLRRPEGRWMGRDTCENRLRLGGAPQETGGLALAIAKGFILLRLAFRAISQELLAILAALLLRKQTQVLRQTPESVAAINSTTSGREVDETQMHLRRLRERASVLLPMEGAQTSGVQTASIHI